MNFITRNIKRAWGRMTMPPDKPKEIPLPNLLHKLLGAVFPHWYERQLDRSVVICRKNYERTLQRLREKWARGEKIRVVFLVQCSAKWKAQTVYDALKADGRFEPIIAISDPINSLRLSPKDTLSQQNVVRNGFESKGYNCIIEYDALRDRHLSLRWLGADIVFYPEASYPHQSPVEVSRFALTMYIPYYVPNYGDRFLDTGLDNHRLFYRYFTLNKEWENLYRDWMSDVSLAGKLVASGHPALDGLITFEENGRKQSCVIYAPHWSFFHPQNPSLVGYGTFEWSGIAVLKYAQMHPEISWIFKPHPDLSHCLIKSGIMSKTEVFKYYDVWRKIGTVNCGEYLSLFNSSTLLITDCGSFLTEYGATGKPILRLMSSHNKLSPPVAIRALYETYYEARNLDELNALLDLLVIGCDPNRDKRIEAINNAGLANRNAGQLVHQEILSLIS